MMKTIKKIATWYQQHSLLVKVIFFASIMVFVVNQVAHIAADISWSDVKSTFAEQGWGHLLLMALMGALAVTPMMLYDYVALRVFEEQGRSPLPRKTFFLSAWITNTINNLAGFGGLVAATLRGNYYGGEVLQKKVVATVSKIALFLLSGLSLLCLLALGFLYTGQATTASQYTLWLWGGAAYAPLLLLFIQFRQKGLFADFLPKGRWLLLFASLGQWLGAFLSFAAIGTLMGNGQALRGIFPLFVAASLIGMLTMVPGGAGTFDVLMIVGLNQLGIRQDVAVVWLLFYRIFYYLLPFFSGLLLFLHQTSIRLNRLLDNLPRLFTQKTAHALLVTALYLAGITMVLLSAVTNLSTLSQVFAWLTSYTFNFLDQTLNIMVGILLLGLARGIAAKVKKAYWPTVLVLAFSIGNTILHTRSWQLILLYSVLLIAVFYSRKELYREKFVYSWGALLVDGLLFGFLLILYGIAGYQKNNQWAGKMLLFFPSDTVWFSGLIGIGLSALVLVTLYQYLTTTDEVLGNFYEPSRVASLIERFGGTRTSQWLTLKDRYCFYYRVAGRDQVLIPYQVKANKCFVLGDPLGYTADFQAATLAFLKQADRLGYQPVFYQSSESYVVQVHDLGYHFMKIGTLGYLDHRSPKADQFRLSTENTQNRQLANQGYQFQWYPQIPSELMPILHQVSLAYLAGGREKQFSYSRFQANYLKGQAIGVMRSPENQVIGFITPRLWQNEAGIDLLRLVPTAPAGATDFLLTHFFAEMQNKARIEVGTAPLATVGNNEFAFIHERFARIFYRFSEQFYGWQDQYQQIVPYVTEWESLYLAYPKHSSILFVFIQLVLLIGRGGSERHSLVATAISELGREG